MDYLISILVVMIVGFFVLWWILYYQIKKVYFAEKIKAELLSVVHQFDQNADRNITLLEQKLTQAEAMLEKMNQQMENMKNMEKQSIPYQRNDIFNQARVQQQSIDSSFLFSETNKQEKQRPLKDKEKNEIIDQVKKLDELQVPTPSIAKQLGIQQAEVETILNILEQDKKHNRLS